MGGVSVQDPFSEGSDPAFHSKRGPYQQGAGPTEPAMRMQYDCSTDPYGAPRKGEQSRSLSFLIDFPEFLAGSGLNVHMFLY